MSLVILVIDEIHLINGLNDGRVQIVSLPEERVERDLADLRPHRRLRQLRDGKLRILNSVTGFVRVLNSQIKDSIYVQCDVICKKEKLVLASIGFFWHNLVAIVECIITSFTECGGSLKTHFGYLRERIC